MNEQGFKSFLSLLKKTTECKKKNQENSPGSRIGLAFFHGYTLPTCNMNRTVAMGKRRNPEYTFIKFVKDFSKWISQLAQDRRANSFAILVFALASNLSWKNLVLNTLFISRKCDNTFFRPGL
jgi:hypothetical protein